MNKKELKKLEKLQASLPAIENGIDDDDNITYAKCPSCIRDGMLVVSGEDAVLTCSYYDDMWISPKLVSWAQKHDGYWEWENPGCIVFVEN